VTSKSRPPRWRQNSLLCTVAKVPGNIAAHQENLSHGIDAGTIFD